MPVLPPRERQAALGAFMREEVSGETFGVTKRRLRVALNAIDQWFEDNQSALNQALPADVRTSLTAAQKQRLLRYVVNRRGGGR